ncbi:hypothetical protein KGF57_001656 [Candida theae]|uniref:Transcription activator GCR1-like domain-containing protein n=1 Tax=Candida theae TaxID=1198502 RepID=A0AAD5BH53_9ASCO|nr:uncharacterized protein KGF57_001656 [Candida theae]KAI5961531.1 hypothetical protein KGF57_001656 [Candida theae]
MAYISQAGYNSDTPKSGNTTSPDAQHTHLALHPAMSSSSNSRTSQSTMALLEAKIGQLTNQFNRIESDRVTPLEREISMLRQLLDFQNTKLDKVTSLLTDLITQVMPRRNKIPSEDDVVMSLRTNGASSPESDDDDESMLRSIRAFQESINVSDLQRHNNVQQQIHQHMGNLQAQQLHQNHQPVIDHNRVSMHRMPNQQQQQQQQQQQHQHQHQNQSQDPASVHLARTISSSMDPELQHVSSVLSENILSRQVSQDNQLSRRLNHSQEDIALKQKSKSRKRKRGETNDAENTSRSDTRMSSKVDQGGDSTPQDKIHIEFIHHPSTVREIYDEFYKGIKGQEPLCELDEKYGKLKWRGNSRSKDSKRYQRRKRLCEAIKRGSQKYNKSDDEMIEYFETFRKNKSLTWLMNGNIPEELAE